MRGAVEMLPTRRRAGRFPNHGRGLARARLLLCLLHQQTLADLDAVALQLVPLLDLLGRRVELPRDAEQCVAAFDGVVERLLDERVDSSKEFSFGCRVLALRVVQ